LKISTQILLAFGITLLISAVDSYTNYLLSLKVQRNIEFVSKSEAVIRNSNSIHKNILQMQSGFRGYLLTLDTSFLDSYREGEKVVGNLMQEQKKLVRENQSQLNIIDSIAYLHHNWYVYSQNIINKRKQADLGIDKQVFDQAFDESFKKQVGKKINDRIKLKVNEFDKIEYQVRNQRREALIDSIDQTQAISLIFIIFIIVIGVSSVIIIIRRITRRIDTLVKQAENISGGEFTSVKDEQNDELTGLSTSLNVMSGKLKTNFYDLKSRNEELNNFAYVVSHDLKAPVRGIHNVVKWIEEDLHEELSPQMKEYLRIIPTRTKRMEDLINGLLEYARISENYTPAEANIREMLGEIIADIAPKDVSFEISDMPVFITDKLRLEQVFTNLISNAVRYTLEKPAKIKISSRDYGRFYEFSVRDYGIGIAPEYHEKIFGIFQTLREKHDKESTGVGLAIVKKIIDKKNARIKVISEPGKGTEMIFTWPK